MIDIDDRMRRLRAAFDADRLEVLARARPREGLSPMLCRYCGKLWRPMRNTTLDGHAACYVSPEFMRMVACDLQLAAVTLHRVAKALGVSLFAIQSWRRAVERDAAGQSRRAAKKYAVTVSSETRERVAAAARERGISMAKLVAKAVEGLPL